MLDLDKAVAEGLHTLEPVQEQRASEEHANFLSRFPASAWDTLTLEQYALGTDRTRESYCYALEWGTPTLGSIRGGTAAKHLIFQRRKSGEWYWAGDQPSVSEAWLALRDGYRSALELAAAGKWADIAAISALAPAKVVKLKTLYLYQPEGVLPIYSGDHLRHFAEQLDVDQHGDLVVLNRRLLEHLRGQSATQDLPGLNLARLLYRAAAPPDWHAPTWVKIAPGPQASLWQDCLDGGFICVGWDAVGDLTTFDNEEDFRQAFAEAYPHKGSKSQQTRKAKELWRLLELRPGDKVVANRGTTEIVGVGTVTDAAYEWRPERQQYKHVVGVAWAPDSGRVVDPPVKAWATTTVLPVPRRLVERLFGEEVAEDDDVQVAADLPADPQYVEWDKALRRKKQIIFYGPPGTGKTRAARGFLRWWLGRQLLDASASSSEVDQTLTYRAVANRAWWVTANPDEWSWNEMFELDGTGYRRGRIQKHYNDISSGDMVLCYETAPTQRVVGLARVVDVHADDEGEPLRLLPIGRLPSGPTWAELGADDVVRDSEPVKSGARGTLFALRDAEFQRILELAGLNDTYLGEVASDLSPYLTEVTFHASYTYEEFVEGYRPARTSGSGLTLELRAGLLKRTSRTARVDAPAPYALLIDEINRANVPRVFGELMTLLEADKRGTSVTLPASGEQFVLPENVYLVGTMNTADRSIRTLDAALRRRFAFIELMPDPSLLAGAVVDQLALDSFLAALNERITRTAGREKQIGHSFFLGEDGPLETAEEFAEVLRLEVIPLLQELAYDDYGKLREYLGPDLVDADQQRLKAAADDATQLVAALADYYQAQADVST